MEKYNRSTESGDLTNAIDRAKKSRAAPKKRAGKIALAATTILTLVGSGGYALANRNAEPPEESIVQGQFIVRFEKEIVPGYRLDGSVVTGLEEVDALNKELEGETYRQLAPHSDDHEFDNFFLVDIDDSLDLKDVMKDFRRAEDVEWVGYNIKMGIPELMDATPQNQKEDEGLEGKLPNDPYMHSSGSIPTNPDVDDMWGLLSTDAPEAWEIITGDKETVFAVIDTGIADDHIDIADNMWRNEAEINGILGVDDDGNGYIDDIFGINTLNPERTTYDGHGHGTHVAGTIAAVTDNAIGIAGINWNGKLMAVKVLTDEGMGDLFSITGGIIYAAKNGADVINMSLGGPAGPMMIPIDLAIRYATHKGVITVVAAGNSDQNANRSSPADHPHVITVAATGPDGNRAYFTNWGKKIDVGAPGMWILSTVPENNKIPQEKYPIIDRIYCALHGTSMASPMTAGLVGLILAINPELKGEWKAVREIVRNAVDPYEQEQDKPVGKGIINYVKAVQLALQSRSDNADVPHMERIEYLRENLTEDWHYLKHYPTYFKQGAMMSIDDGLIVASINSGYTSAKVLAVYDHPSTNDGDVDAVVLAVLNLSEKKACTLMDGEFDPVEDTLNEHYRRSTDAWYRALTERNRELRTVVGKKEFSQLVNLCRGKWEPIDSEYELLELLQPADE